VDQCQKTVYLLTLGDGVKRDADGYYWITGRVDDVLNISGHRLGTAEIESALVLHKNISEAAVVGSYRYGFLAIQKKIEFYLPWQSLQFHYAPILPIQL
jgi:long-subunit acyl-CoA synthetase (AMP-forming)